MISIMLIRLLVMVLALDVAIALIIRDRMRISDGLDIMVTPVASRSLVIALKPKHRRSRLGAYFWCRSAKLTTRFNQNNGGHLMTYFDQTRSFHHLGDAIAHLNQDNGPPYTDCSTGIGAGGRYPSRTITADKQPCNSGTDSFWLHRTVDGVRESLRIVGRHDLYDLDDIAALVATGQVFFNDTEGHSTALDDYQANQIRPLDAPDLSADPHEGNTCR